MTIAAAVRRLWNPGSRDPELEEWARHHDDPRSRAGFALFVRALAPDVTEDQLRALWEEANRLVGKRAPADYGEFLAYGYIQGRRHALRAAPSRDSTPDPLER